MKIIKRASLRIYETFSSKQFTASPQIFFLLFLYLLLYKNEQPPADIYLLSFFPLTLYVTLRFNLMFMIADFVKLLNPFFGFAIFLLTISLACNQKWKTFIFLFKVGSQLSKSANYQAIYLPLASALFCHEIYHNLTCRTLKDNHKYFTGFFAIAVYSTINFIYLNFGISFSVYGKVIMVAVSGLYAYYLFKRRLEGISKLSIGQIKDCRLLAFYLRQFEEEVRTKYVKESKVSIHRRQCSNVHCFCCRKETLNRQSFFIRQLYENAIKKFPQSFDTLLYQNYVDYLLENQLFLNCLHFLGKWNHSSHYSFIAKLKCINKIKKLFKNLDSSNLYEKQYKYALNYDDILLNLTMQIYQILELKLKFWHETAKETPKMITLQEEGLHIVDNMYALNIYYNDVIKKYEKKLYCFDATILYAMYLLSTTNFKEYAELIIKNTSKVLEEIQVLQNNSSQTYAIKAIVLQKGLFYIKDILTELQYISAQNLKMEQKNQDCKFKIVIDNASHSFCKLVKINKEQLIGQQLGVLIPDGYKHVHKARLLKVLDFQCEELGDIVSSKHLHNNKKLPIKVGENGLIMSYISIKTMVDLESGSSFVSVVKKMDEKTINALITFNGDLQQRDEGFNEQILMHSEFKKYLQIIIDRWNKQNVIKQQRFNVMINSMNFCIIISSPLAKNFIDDKQKLERQGIYPPLHVQIVNQSTNKNKGAHGNTHDKLVKEFRHMQNAINHDSESTSSSKNSTAAINILSTFSEKNTAPIYRRIIIGFIFVITCCLIVSMIGFLVCNIEWDNTNMASNNPLNDTINFMKMQHLTANILLNLWDIQEYQANPSLNQTEIRNYFGSRNSYLKSTDSLVRDKFSQFKSNLYNSLRNPSSILLDEQNKRFNTLIAISDMSVVPSNYTFQQQSLTFQSLMMNYLVDFNLMTKGVYDNTLMMPISYSEVVINLQNSTGFVQIIDVSIDSSLNTSLILAICMSILILFLLILMFFFLRSRLSMHQKIFDLFASIESEMVINQIRSLTYISNIIKNYGQSSEILKTNVIQYQQNAIYPKRGSSRKSSVNNEIVVGLQKFDMAQEISPREEVSDRLKGKDTERSPFKNKTRRKSHLTNYQQIKQYMEMKKTLQKRKRAGDLDFTGSQSDPKMHINKNHIIIYIMTLIFVVFLSLEVIVTQNFGLQMKARKNSLSSILNTYTSNQLSFLLGKLYLRNGNAVFGTIDPRYGLIYLQSQVQAIPAYDYANSYGYDTLKQNCTSASRGGNITTSMTVCMYNYSYLTLLGQFGAIFKQLFEARYNADQNYNSYVAKNQTDIYNQILTNISSKTFYLQSVDNQMQSIVYSIVDLVYQSMYDYTLSINSIKLSIFIASVCWWVVTAIVGITVILRMKRQYFKEVYMLTFLNSQMIINNKRVESFLDSINKSSTN